MKMKRILTISLPLVAMLFAVTAQATLFDVRAYDDAYHAVWVPGLDQRQLLLDSTGMPKVEADVWNLSGDLTSTTEGSKWQIPVDLSNVFSGAKIGGVTSKDGGPIKGTTWAVPRPGGSFPETVVWTFVPLDGPLAGQGFSPWLAATDKVTNAAYRGEANVRVSAPVPEPSAALVFGLGTVLTSSVIRRSRKGSNGSDGV